MHLNSHGGKSSAASAAGNVLSGRKGGGNSIHRDLPAASALHKRLQQSEDDADGDADGDADDTGSRGVQFIPGVPGHSKRKKVPPQLELQDDEVEYFKSKNKALYEAQARAQAAKSREGWMDRMEGVNKCPVSNVCWVECSYEQADQMKYMRVQYSNVCDLL